MATMTAIQIRSTGTAEAAAVAAAEAWIAPNLAARRGGNASVVLR